VRSIKIISSLNVIPGLVLTNTLRAFGQLGWQNDLDARCDKFYFQPLAALFTFKVFREAHPGPKRSKTGPDAPRLCLLRLSRRLGHRAAVAESPKRSWASFCPNAPRYNLDND
jgi:hypothetical protein